MTLLLLILRFISRKCYGLHNKEQFETVNSVSALLNANSSHDTENIRYGRTVPYGQLVTAFSL